MLTVDMAEKLRAIVFNNASYSILNVELERVGAGAGGPKVRSQLDIGDPRIDFARLARSMGVHGTRVDTGEDLMTALRYALAHPGPHLIEAMVPPALGRLQRRVLPWILRSLPGLPAGAQRAIKRKVAP